MKKLLLNILLPLLSLTAFAQLPLSVDNSRSKYFPPLIQQIGGSCAQASSIGYMFTYEVNRMLDRDASLAQNRFSYLYTWNLLNEGIDQGGTGVDGLQLASQNGIMTEADFPYQSSSYSFRWASGYEKYLEAMHYKIERFVPLDAKTEADIEAIKQYLYNKNDPSASCGGIVTFSSQSSNWKMDDFYSGPSETGYKSILTSLATDGAHAMTIVGYDDLVEFTSPEGSLTKGAFIVVNSWGSWSHDNGRYYLPYWFFLQERSNLVLSQDVTGVVPRYSEPQVVFRVALDFTSRDDLAFSVGVSPQRSAKSPMHNNVVSIANHQGGDHPMQGAYDGSDIELGFDFTPFSKTLENIETPNYFLTIDNAKRGNKEGSGKLLAFSVYDYRDDPLRPKVYTCPLDAKGVTLTKGKNVFNIPTVPPDETSYSSVEWLNIYGYPLTTPFIIRTAKGSYAKLRFIEYNREDGTMTIRYLYNPRKGDRSLK